MLLEYLLACLTSFHLDSTFFESEDVKYSSTRQFYFPPPEGGSVVWTKLQEVLASVEDSISSKRSWAAPITVSDREKHQQHLKAAEESWAKATQVFKLNTSKSFIYLIY